MLVGILGAATTVEFVLLVGAEIKDGNPWSATTRIVGLIVTGTIGLFVWRQFKRLQESKTGLMGTIVASEAHEQVERFGKCQSCECPIILMEERSQLCPSCWRQSVDKRLEAMERDHTVRAEARELMERAPTTIQDRSPRAPFTASDLPDVPPMPKEKP